MHSYLGEGGEGGGGGAGNYNPFRDLGVGVLHRDEYGPAFSETMQQNVWPLYGAANCEVIQKSLLAGDTTALDIKPRVEQGTKIGTEQIYFEA